MEACVSVWLLISVYWLFPTVECSSLKRWRHCAWHMWMDGWMAHSSLMRILGRFMVSSCMLIGGCRVWFLMRRPYCTLDRWKFGLRMTGMLHALSASCVFPLRLHASASNLWLALLTDECQWHMYCRENSCSVCQSIPQREPSIRGMKKSKTAHIWNVMLKFTRQETARLKTL